METVCEGGDGREIEPKASGSKGGGGGKAAFQAAKEEFKNKVSHGGVRLGCSLRLTTSSRLYRFRVKRRRRP